MTDPTNDQQPIDERAIASLSVAPDAPNDDAAASSGTPAGNAGGSKDARQDAGRDPTRAHDKLDEALDETMDASDPVSATQPGRGEPAPSSGFNAAEEAERQRDA